MAVPSPINGYRIIAKTLSAGGLIQFRTDAGKHSLVVGSYSELAAVAETLRNEKGLLYDVAAERILQVEWQSPGSQSSN